MTLKYLTTAKKSISIIQQIPVIQTFWQKVRERKIVREHDNVASFWHAVIRQYFDNKIEKYTLSPKKELISDKIIWQYWGQGLNEEDLPEVVQICFKSVDKYKDDYQIVRLTDDVIQEYIDLPDFVWEKRQNSAFSRVFFSDLLRLTLLHVYGGVWLDATVLLTGALPKCYNESDHFVFQRDANAQYKSHWQASYAYYWNWNPRFKVNCLNSVFFAKKGSVVVSHLLDLMLYYWKTQDKIINYFFFQVLYHELMHGYLTSHSCPVVDDTLPHLLQTKINGGLDQATLDEILENNTIHKLTYFAKDGVDRLKKIIDPT